MYETKVPVDYFSHSCFILLCYIMSSVHVLYYFVCIVISNVILFQDGNLTLSWNKPQITHILELLCLLPPNPSILHWCPNVVWV